MFLSDVSGLSKGSHALVKAKCGLRSSEKCVIETEQPYKDILTNMGRNNGNFICMACSRKTKYTGRNNPNCRYKFDDDLFHTIDTENKAYLLGWIASDGHIRDDGFVISIHERDSVTLQKLRDIICCDLPIANVKDNMISLTVNSKTMAEDIVRHLKLVFDGTSRKKDRIVMFPDLPNSELRFAFIRGYFDGDGCLGFHTDGSPRCSIASYSDSMLRSLAHYSGEKNAICEHQIEWYGRQAIVFLSRLYGNASIYLDRKYEKYAEFENWQPSETRHCNELTYRKNGDDTKRPTKEAAGYLVYAKRLLVVSDNVAYFDTDIEIMPQEGYILEMVLADTTAKCSIPWHVTYTERELVPVVIPITGDWKSHVLPCPMVYLIPKAK